MLRGRNSRSARDPALGTSRGPCLLSAKRHKSVPSLQFKAPRAECTPFSRRILRATPECLPKPARALLTSTRVWDGFITLPRAAGGLLSINSFDDDTGGFLVLGNDKEHHSLWAAFADVPVRRRLIHGEEDRASCLDFIQRSWSDVRPLRPPRRLGRWPGF